MYAAQSVLGHFCGRWDYRRYHPANMVGTPGHHSYRGRELVGRLSKRLVLADALLGIPGTLLSPNINHLADVIRVVSADVLDGGSPRLQLGLTGVLDQLFELGHH